MGTPITYFENSNHFFRAVHEAPAWRTAAMLLKHPYLHQGGQLTYPVSNKRLDPETLDGILQVEVTSTAATRDNWMKTIAEIRRKRQYKLIEGSLTFPLIDHPTDSFHDVTASLRIADRYVMELNRESDFIEYYAPSVHAWLEKLERIRSKFQ